jgi:hypothetical protein
MNEYYTLSARKELIDYIRNILERSYYDYQIGSKVNHKIGATVVLVNCTEKVFEKVKERAFCERLNKKHKDKNVFFITQREYEDISFRMSLETIANGRNMTIYDEDFYTSKFGRLKKEEEKFLPLQFL